VGNPKIYICTIRYFIESDINGYANDRGLTYFYQPARESIYNFDKINENDYPEKQELQHQNIYPYILKIY
jgi:hypothetical protein